MFLLWVMFEDKTEDKFTKKGKFTIQDYGHKIIFFYNFNFFLISDDLTRPWHLWCGLLKKNGKNNMSEMFFPHFGHFWLEWESVRNGEIWFRQKNAQSIFFNYKTYLGVFLHPQSCGISIYGWRNTLFATFCVANEFHHCHSMMTMVEFAAPIRRW